MSGKVLKAFKYNPKTIPFWNLVAFPVGYVLWLRFWLFHVTAHVKVTGSGMRYQGPAIYVNWHKFIPYLIYHHGSHYRAMLVSSAPYMAPIATWCQLSGLKIVRGASGENGKAALAFLAEALRKGDSVALAIDGPMGPPFKGKRGCIDLARATGVPIVPVSYQCKKGRVNSKRWDFSLAPALFDQILVTYGDPILVRASLLDEEALSQLESSLNQMMDAFEVHS